MRSILPLALLGMSVGLVAWGISRAQDRAERSPQGDEPPAAASRERAPLPVEAARQQARLLHEVYASTLEAIHTRYFRHEQAIVPARALEDVFADIDRRQGIKTRWIGASIPAMSVSHEPKTDFEKQAAKAIAGGAEEFEGIDGGFYRRAGAIPLAADCVACHTGFFRERPKKALFAGLVISIPVKE